MDTSIDDILNGTSEAEAEAVETPPEAEAAPERPRDEYGRFLPKGEQEAEPPAVEASPGASPAPSEPPLDHAALLGERRRRQELERQLEEVLNANRPPPQPAPSIWEDEEGALQHFGSRVVDQATQAATFNARLDMSEMLVRQQNPDFEEAKGRFLEMMRENPAIQQQALSDPHPWDFAYRYVKNADRMNEIGATNVADLEAKLREQIRAELQAEAVQAISGTAPPTLSAERNAGPRSGPAWAGPAPLDDILNT